MTTGTGTSGARNRPFYELPTHIKPCSKIIQETRMELKYSGSTIRPRGDFSRNPSPWDQSINGTFVNGLSRGGGGDFDYASFETSEEASKSSGDVGYGMGGMNMMRAVNTQRPFTPRDSVNLWGVSARKRPPSAITLSRLSIEEGDERPASSSSLFGPRSGSSSPSLRNSVPMSTFGCIPNRFLSRQSGRGLKPLVPKSGLGCLPSQISSSLLEGDESEMDDGNGRVASANGGDIEKERCRLTSGMKSLSLQNVTSDSPPISARKMQPLWVLGSLRNSELEQTHGFHFDEEDRLRNNGLEGAESDGVTLGKKKRLSDRQSENYNNVNGRGDQVNGQLDLKAEADVLQDPYREINNLEVAIEYLRCFVAEMGTNDKPQKADVVSILKRIRENFASSGGTEVSPKLHKQLLHLIFKIVEKSQTDEDILFWSSFVLLHCNIIGSNLTTVFKMVFKSSRSKDYKDIIDGTEYLNVLMKSFGQICPKTQTESMIYGYGTLKFICEEASVLNRVIDLNLIPIMTLHLKILNCEIGSDYMQNDKIPEGILNGAFQLTSILRSVVGEDRALISVVQSGLLEELCSTLTWTIEDIDVLTNIVRILSVVSMDIGCCEVMQKNEHLCGAVVLILKQWYAKDDVMVRLAYCLGNLLANADDMRVKLYEEPEAFQYVMKVMSHYVEKSKTSPSSATIDILVKTTRIFANWILNPFVGSELCDDPYLSELLFRTLQIKDISQELVLCVMCALNNTSFYMNYNELDEGTMRTVEYLYKNLDMKDLDARTEAVKVLGNLTRNEEVKLLSAAYMENILMSLEEDPAPVELLCATCGVLINVVIDEEVKPEFLKKKGVERLIRVLERKKDIMVSLMTSQVIWNLLISHENHGCDLNECISPEKKIQLTRILLDKLQLSKRNNSGSNKNFIPLSKVDEDDSDVDLEVDHSHENNVEYVSMQEFQDQDDTPSDQVIYEDFQSVAKDLVAKLQ